LRIYVNSLVYFLFNLPNSFGKNDQILVRDFSFIDTLGAHELVCFDQIRMDKKRWVLFADLIIAGQLGRTLLVL
jgi:hypothetical protein